MKTLQIKEPIDIFLTTFKRLHLLKKTIKSIYDNTEYPHRLWVANNDKDDLIVPDLKPDWLSRLTHLMDNNKDYGAICLRIERTRRRDIDEFKDLIPSDTACPAVFRITSKEMIETIGHSSRPHWESHTFSNKVKSTGKKLAMATKIYASHIGFIKNKGFEEGFKDYKTYSPERVNQNADQPYPYIDEKTNIPIKINTVRDSDEHKRRQEYYDYWGRDDRTVTKRTTLVEEQKELAEYCKVGTGLDLGCGWMKCHENAIGMDVFPHDTVDIVGDCTDLWMFKDNELDFIVNSHLLEHLPDFISALKEWKRVIKVGGIIAIAFPDGTMKPKYLLKNGHKVNIGMEDIRLVFKFILKMKILRLEYVKKSPGKFVTIIVGKKVK